jgi:Zn-dependent protease
MSYLSYITEPTWLITLGILLFTSMPLHEFAHAWAAFELGDDTAARRGRLTLNPLVHMDVIGTITLAARTGFGWGKPVPVIRSRLRGNRRASHALVSVAGPFSNFLLAMLAAVPFRLGWLDLSRAFTPSSITFESVLWQFIGINLGLMIFNLIPIPPLDGSRILAWVLPIRWATALDELERFAGLGMLVLFMLLSRTGIFSLVMAPVYNFLLEALIFR